MKIIVTGAAGAIGSHLAERFAEKGHKVVGIDAFTEYYRPALKEVNARDVEAKGVRIERLDLAVDFLDGALEGAEAIFHLAAQPGISATTPFDDYLQNNIVATHRLLEASSKLNSLKAFVIASTSSVYGAHANGSEDSELKPTSVYGVTKLAAEQLAMSKLRSGGLPVAALRFFSVYGERERPEKFYYKLIKSMFEDAEFPLYEGSENHVRSYTYVKDIIDGCELVLSGFDKCVGQIFNLGTDKTSTTGEGLRTVEEIMGKKAKLKILPRRVGDQLETSADISKARKLLGYDPKVGLRDGLAAQIRWYGEKIHDRS